MQTYCTAQSFNWKIRDKYSCRLSHLTVYNSSSELFQIRNETQFDLLVLICGSLSFSLSFQSFLQVINLLPSTNRIPPYVTCNAKVRALCLSLPLSSYPSVYQKEIDFRLKLHEPFNKATRLNQPVIRTAASFGEKLPRQTMCCRLTCK